MLLWLWILALYSALVVAQHRFRSRALVPYVDWDIDADRSALPHMLIVAEIRSNGCRQAPA